jgi:hypothetical protein
VHVELVALHTTASWDKDAAKHQICSKLEGCVAELGEGPVAPHLAFNVGHGFSAPSTKLRPDRQVLVYGRSQGSLLGRISQPTAALRFRLFFG